MLNMKKLSTEIVINATADRVWTILMDFEAYPGWNPFIKSIIGTAKIGEQLKVTLQPKDKQPMQFSPQVIIHNKGKEFRWLGHLFVKGLFDGAHYFKLEPLNTNQTRLIHGEDFSGVMATPLLKMIGANTLEGFKAMNQALKTIAENHH